MRLLEIIFGTKETKVDGGENMTAPEFRKSQRPIDTIEYRRDRRYIEMTSRARRRLPSEKGFGR